MEKEYDERLRVVLDILKQLMAPPQIHRSGRSASSRQAAKKNESQRQDRHECVIRSRQVFWRAYLEILSERVLMRQRVQIAALVFGSRKTVSDSAHNGRAFHPKNVGVCSMAPVKLCRSGPAREVALLASSHSPGTRRTVIQLRRCPIS